MEMHAPAEPRDTDEEPDGVETDPLRWVRFLCVALLVVGFIQLAASVISLAVLVWPAVHPAVSRQLIDEQAFGFNRFQLQTIISSIPVWPFAAWGILRVLLQFYDEWTLDEAEEVEA